MSAPLLDVRGLAVEYPRGRRSAAVRALDGIDLQVRRGETLAVVGESGSGKSSLANAILGLAPITAGSVILDGEEITAASARRRRALSATLQCVFQDPYGSLNPSRTIAQTLVEPLLVHEQLDRHEREARVAAALERVGLDPAAADRLPGRFSGGQRQRIAIARALMLAPALVICDEPTSALDLSVQAQVLNLLADLQQRTGVSYLFVSHDLGVVRRVADRVAVLRHGAIVESGLTQRLFDAPTHPYTQALLSAAPVADPVAQRRRREARPRAMAAPLAADATSPQDPPPRRTPPSHYPVTP
ncbi:MAG: hypothetical protein V7607_2101 [Solirubrobacteraceae bacterium]